MTLIVYHLKTCDTCRKAIKAMQAAGHRPELIDVRADGVPTFDLARFAKAVGWEKPQHPFHNMARLRRDREVRHE